MTEKTTSNASPEASKPAAKPIEKKPLVASAPPVAQPVEKKPPVAAAPPVAKPAEKKPPVAAAPPVAKPVEKKPPVAATPSVAKPVEKKPPVAATPPVAKPIEKKPPVASAPPVVQPVEKKPPVAAAPSVAKPAEKKPPVAAASPVAKPIEKKPPVAAAPPVVQPVEKKPPVAAAPPVVQPIEKKPPVAAVPPVAKPVEKKPPVAAAPPVAKPVEKKPLVAAAPPVEKKPPVAAAPPVVQPIEKKPPVAKSIEKKPPVAVASPAVQRVGGVRPQKKRRNWLKASFILGVILPSLLGTLYITLVASDRYVAGAGFVVRSMKGGGGTDFLGAFTGLSAGGSTTSDAYMIMKYMKSRDLLERLEVDFGFRSVYESKEIDLLSRLWPDQEIEKVLGYWKRRISTSFDPTSGIVNFEVQAFSDVEAKRIVELVMSYANELVNDLSEQARKDVMSYAEGDVVRAEERLMNALKLLRGFRGQGDSLDPAASAMAQIEILAGLEIQLLSLQTRMAALGETVDADAPSLTALRRQAEAVETQIQQKSGGLNMAGSDEDLSELLAKYEEIQVEKGFAEKAYISSLASLEAARIEAGQQQRYLAVYSKPALPEHPLYPRRILYPLLLVVVSMGLWGVGTLMVYAVRDHIS